MANGLEREFPEVAWRAVPPIGPRGISPELVRGHIARGCELHGRAIRHRVRSGLGAIARALLAIVITSRDRSRSSARRLSERESSVTSAHGA